MKLASTTALAVWLAASSAAAQPCEADADCDEGACVDGACAPAPTPSPEPRAEVDPSGVRVETRSYLPLTVAGACTFGAAWIATIALASAAVATESPSIGLDGQPRERDIGPTVGGAFVPVVGPVVLRAEGAEPRDDTVNAVLVVLMGAQAMGLLATFLGATIESRVELPAAAVLPTVTQAPDGSLGGGLFAVGRF